MKHPLDFIPPATRRGILIGFAVWTIILMAIFQVLDIPLRTTEAPFGIISYELAGSSAKASAILESWDSPAKLMAAFGLGLDFLFMPSYAITISLGILQAASRRGRGFAWLGALLGWLILAAAILDAVENIALSLLLFLQTMSLWPEIAAICAGAKFALILLGLAYILLGWLWPKKK